MATIPANMLPSCPPDPWPWVDCRKPEEIPDQAERDDLEMLAWGLGTKATKQQMTKAYNALWRIMQEINRSSRRAQPKG